MTYRLCLACWNAEDKREKESEKRLEKRIELIEALQAPTRKELKEKISKDLLQLRVGKFKNKVRAKSKKAIQSGEIRKLYYCERCGKRETLHIHHIDYNHKDSYKRIFQLCQPCHAWAHNNTVDELIKAILERRIPQEHINRFLEKESSSEPD